MKTIAICPKLLARLIDRLEARIPEPTTLTDPARLEQRQRIANDGIERDVALVDEARHLLRPSFKRTVDEFASWTLEEMRMGREVAHKNGNMARVMALATAIDIKRGFYK